jgi:hypothetical protein
MNYWGTSLAVAGLYSFADRLIWLIAAANRALSHRLVSQRYRRAHFGNVRGTLLAEVGKSGSVRDGGLIRTPGPDGGRDPALCDLPIDHVATARLDFCP